MPKIKEIRKITKEIKEIKKEMPKSLDEEVDEGSEDVDGNSASFNGFRRFNKTSTLAANEMPQEDTAVRAGRISKEDEEEVHFRPSYTGGGSPYKSNSYTPVGSPESAASKGGRELRESAFESDRSLGHGAMEQPRGEASPERNYAGEQEQKKDKRRNL